MGRYEQPREPLFDELDGPFLVGLGNWLAESLDASDLSNEQVLLVHLVMDRCLDVLWRQFPEVLMPLMARFVERLELDEDE